eukprot:450919-Pyramimonas_sp.AAC.1
MGGRRRGHGCPALARPSRRRRAVAWGNAGAALFRDGGGRAGQDARACFRGREAATHADDRPLGPRRSAAVTRCF